MVNPAGQRSTIVPTIDLLTFVFFRQPTTISELSVLYCFLQDDVANFMCGLIWA